MIASPPTQTVERDAHMFEIICTACGAALYTGVDLKAARDVLRATNGRCKHCGTTLNVQDFTVEVLKIGQA